MPLHQRKVKVIEFSLGTPAEDFECQVKTWTLTNNSGDPNKLYSQCPDGEAFEETEDDYALELEFYSDWRSDGVSDWLWDHDREDVAFQLDHHPDIPAEHVRWTGTCHIVAPNVGGEARTTEMTSVTLRCIGKPVKTRPSESS